VALQAAGGMAASMAVAWLSYQCFEKHFLQLKRFWGTNGVDSQQSTVDSDARPRATEQFRRRSPLPLRGEGTGVGGQ